MVVTDQLPHQGPVKGACQCTVADDGCGAWGTLGRPDGMGRRHVRGCPCRRCRGRRSRRGGMDKQRAAGKALGIANPTLGANNEEDWRGALRVEVKSGHRETVPIDTRYRAIRKQADARKSIGDNRPFAAIVMPPGMSDGYAIIRLSELQAVAEAVAGHAERIQ